MFIHVYPCLFSMFLLWEVYQVYSISRPRPGKRVPWRHLCPRTCAGYCRLQGVCLASERGPGGGCDRNGNLVKNGVEWCEMSVDESSISPILHFPHLQWNGTFQMFTIREPLSNSPWSFYPETCQHGPLSPSGKEIQYNDITCYLSPGEDPVNWQLCRACNIKRSCISV